MVSASWTCRRRDTGRALREGPVPVIELRAGIIVGPGSAAFEVMRDLVLNLPLMITPRWVQARSPPIALDDLLEYLVRLPRLEQARGRTFDAGGAEELTYAQMMRRMAVIARKRPPRIVSVPVLTPTLSSCWLRLVTAVPTPVARALIGGLKHDLWADDAELRQLVPMRLKGFDESVRLAFAAGRGHTLLARWTEGAFAARGFRIEHAYYAKRASVLEFELQPLAGRGPRLTAPASGSPASVQRRVFSGAGGNPAASC